MNMQQYKVNLKINILKEVTACKYDIGMKDLIVNAVLESMAYSNNMTQSRIAKRTIGTDVIIMAYIVMKCSFKERVYDVPVIIYFMKKMPYEPPQFFVDLPVGKMINPNNREIDPNTRRITTMKLFKWSPTTDIISVLNEIQESFNRNFPIVNINTSNHNRINQSVYSNSNQLQANAFYNQQQMNHQSQISNQYNNNTHPQSQSQFQNQTLPMPQIKSNDWTVISSKSVPSNEVIQTLDKAQSLFSPEQANEFLKQVLQAEIVEKIESRLKDEGNKMLQQKDRLINYQKLFVIEDKKLMTYLANTGVIQERTNDIFKDINLEISNARKYIAQNESRTFEGSNIMDYISMGNERNAKVISLIAKEAMIEEIISISKKAFERQSVDFINSIKFIRAESRSLFKVKLIRERLQQIAFTP